MPIRQMAGTRRSASSIDEIAGFSTRVNPTRATSFVLELRDAVTRPQAHPGLGKADRVPGTRELVLHNNDITIYRKCGEDVEIVRLHHLT